MACSTAAWTSAAPFRKPISARASPVVSALLTDNVVEPGTDCTPFSDYFHTFLRFQLHPRLKTLRQARCQRRRPPMMRRLLVGEGHLQQIGFRERTPEKLDADRHAVVGKT